MAVPVDAHVRVLARHELREETHERRGALGRGVAHRVADADSGGAGSDGRPVERDEILGARAGRVLGHERDVKSVAHAERHGVAGELHHAREVPVLRVLPDRRRPDERRHLQRPTRVLRDLDDRLDVGRERARRAAGFERQARLRHAPDEPLQVRDGAAAGGRDPDDGHVDPEPLHQDEKLELLVERRRDGRGGLEPVPERLVDQLDGNVPGPALAGGPVPVVHEVLWVHRALPRRAAFPRAGPPD